MRGPIARSLGLVVGLSTALAVLLGLSIGHWLASPGPAIRRKAMRGEWIAPHGEPSYAGYFRRRISIPGPVKHAWISVAPWQAYEICVNRNPSGRIYLWRPTRPFQTGSNEPGQLLNASPAALALNFPREYQWSSHRTDWLPAVHDITPSLKPGPNVITIEAESRAAPAMLKFEGEILLWSGQRIRIDSDSSWLAEPVPPFDPRYDWTEPKYRDLEWQPAVEMSRLRDDLPDLHFQSFDPRVMTTPFAGCWARDERAGSGDSVWFSCNWDLPSRPEDAWLRLATNRTYDLFVNRRRVNPALLGNPDLDSGDWVLGTPRGADMPAAPELLDPDEVGAVFVGDRFESPRHGDPSQLAFKRRENTLNVTRDKARATTRSDLPGTYDPIKAEGEDVMPHDPLPYLPEDRDAKAMGRDRAIGGLSGYDVRSMLHAGRNLIEVRLSAPLAIDGFSWGPQMALDGEAVLEGGARRRVATGEAVAWNCQVQRRDGSMSPPNPATILGPAKAPGKPWPMTVFRGVAIDPGEILRQKVAWLAGSAMMALLLAGGSLAASIRRSRRTGEPIAATLDQAARRLGRALLPPISVLSAALMVETSWAERNETILFRLEGVWPCVLAAAALSPLLISRPMLGLMAGLSRLPKTRLWWPLLAATLVLCGVLRIYKLDFQPLDDDEYASCQAVIGIARTGAPAFVPEGVYYTRSPGYHYLVGAIVWLFGENLWAMRIPCAAFGVATGLLIYRLADRLMHRPWVGYGALVFFTIHPFAIYSSHLVRFYQQQQFFALVAVYWFIEGFTGNPSQKYRYLTVLAFLVAVVSQEITAIMIFQLALGLFLLGRDAGWPANIKLAIATAIAMGFIVLDLLVFQTLCLTRTEGVSPNVEASIKPHFWDPYNFASLFLGYSRLHVAPSLTLLCGLPLLLCRGGRVVWTLLFFLVTGVAFTNLMVSHVSLRYQYWLIPLWLLLSLRALGLLAERLAAATGGGGTLEDRRVAATLVVPILLAFLLAWSPWRIVDSYDTKILNDSTGAFRYVRGQLRPGDAIAANEPHPHAAHLEAGHVDYDLTVPLLHDFVMLKDGRLIDRNGGGRVIATLDDLVEACRTHERLWVVVNREKFRTRGKNLRWEYPGARIELFLRKNFQIANRTYLWTVFLWDQSKGHYKPFREH